MMKLRFGLSALAVAAMMSFASVSPAQEPAAEPAQQIHKQLGPADIIMPHITDSKNLDVPCFKSLQEWSCEIELPSWPVTIGGKTVDLGLTKHVVFLMLSGVLCVVLLVGVARAHARSSHAVGRPKGFAAGFEAIILYLRNEIYLPVLGGHGGAAYVPFCLTLFFFILFCNLFGLLPWGSTPTGNVAVTATLALITFIVVETAGMKALGAGYIGTIIYWPHDMPAGAQAPADVHHDAGRARRKVHEALRAHDPFVREHDLRARDHSRAHRPHLHVRLQDRDRSVGDGALHHGRRDPGGLHSGFHLLAARRGIHRTDSVRASLRNRRSVLGTARKNV